MQTNLQRRIARQYGMPLQVAAFFAILILSEQTDPDCTFTAMGTVSARMLVHKLRKYLKGTSIEIRSLRGIGYWLEPDQRRELANYYGIELGISLPTRGIADESLHSGTNAGDSAFQLPEV